MRTLLAQGPKAPKRNGGTEVVEVFGGQTLGNSVGRASVPGQIAPSDPLYVPNPYTTVVPLDLSNGRVPTQKEVSGQGAMCGALAPAAPADPAEFEVEIDKKLQGEGFRQGLKTKLPAPETAGLAPGVRAASQRLEDAKKRVKDAKEANRDFALSMLDWNANDFEKAVGKMEAYIEKHPRSPWLPEALIHMGDYAKFTAQPTRAQQLYQRVMEITSATPVEMSYEAHQKAYERWADLYLVEGRWAEARPMLEELVENDLHWRRRTWADYWLRQIDIKSNDRNQLLAMRNCGPLALAIVFDELGRNESARRVAALRPAEEEGVSLEQMRQIAAREGLEVQGFRARASQLAALPLPLILHYAPLSAPKPRVLGTAKGNAVATKVEANTQVKAGAPGHFMIVRAIDARRGTASLVNPQDGARSTLTLAQLGREWSGNGLMIASTPKARLAQSDVPTTARWLATAKTAPGAMALKTAAKTGQNVSKDASKSAAKSAPKNAAAPRVALLSTGEMKAVRGTCYVVSPQNGLGENAANDGCTTGNCPPNRGTPGVAVNQLSQNVFINDTPIWYDPAFGPSIDITLSYNSHDASGYNSLVGNKWSLNFGSHLLQAPTTSQGQSRVTLFSSDGNQIIFEPAGTGVDYISPRGVYDTLVRTGTNSYTLSSPEGERSFYGVPQGINSSVAMLLEQRDRWGNALKLTYKSNTTFALIDTVTAADGMKLDFSYDQNGRLAKVSDAFERHADFRYDANGNLVECVDMAGYVFQYRYDALVNVRQLHTPQGEWNFLYTRRTENTINGKGQNSVTVVDPLLQRKKYEWENHYAITTDWHLYGTPDPEKKQTRLYAQTLIDNSAKTPTEINTSESAIGKVIAPTGETVIYTYANDDGGRTSASRTLAPIAVTDARNYTTNFTYNDQGNVTSTTDPKGNITRMNYSADGLDVVEVINANGVSVLGASYDLRHQPSSITTEEGTSTYTYTGWGALQSVSDPLGETTYTYNPASYNAYSVRLQSVARNGATLGSLIYDNVGRLYSATDASGLEMRYAYDSLNRVTKTFYPDGTSEATDYTWGGLAGTTQDRAGRKSYYDYDALKRLVRVQDAQGQTLQMDYDRSGNLVQLMDAKGYLTRWAYDKSDRPLQKLYHDGTTEAFGYSGGLLSQTTSARGAVTSYGYDANANLTGINYPNMAGVSLTYNALDDVTQIVDGVGTHGFSYSNTGRLLGQDGPFANDNQSYGYDGPGRLISQSVERGTSGGTQSQSYTFDALERLATLTSGGTQGVGAFTYNYVGNTGMLNRLDLPNRTHTSQSYDGLNRLTQVVNQKNTGADLNKFAYAYDTRDVRTGVQSQHGTDPLRQISYGYDVVDQLKTESASGGLANTNYSNAFDYDGMGNRTRWEKVSGGNTQVTRSEANQLNQLSSLSQSANGSAPTTSGFGYDLAGNTTLIESADGGKMLFTYDDAERLVRVERQSAAGVSLGKSEFLYDYASRKAVSREFTWTNGAWVKTEEKRRVFDGLDVIQERNAANEVTAQLVRDGNIGGILARSTGAGVTFFGYDGGGNVTLLTDENGDDVGRYRYDAFGNTLEVSGAPAAENPYRFSTKELHAQSGLYDYGYRFYSPGLGRWINRDPIQENGGVNLYAMVANNPVNSVDIYGLEDLSIYGGDWGVEGWGWTYKALNPYPPAYGGKNLVKPSKEQAIEAIANADRFYFWGHGGGNGSIWLDKKVKLDVNDIKEIARRRKKLGKSKMKLITLDACWTADSREGVNAWLEITESFQGVPGLTVEQDGGWLPRYGKRLKVSKPIDYDPGRGGAKGNKWKKKRKK